MWRTINIWSNHFMTSISDFVKTCKYAIDRSCGEMQDISIPCVGTISLHEYIADSASHLRRLGLVNACEFSDEHWSKVAKKLSLLEELVISSSVPSRNTLEIFARCRPFLKSLKFICIMYIQCEDEAEAFAISKMSTLRHLKLSGCWLADDDLLAILEACPHLESLDILEYINLELSECLLKRCHEQIKHFLPPFNLLEGLGDPCDYYDNELSGSLSEDSNGPTSCEFLDYNYGSD